MFKNSQQSWINFAKDNTENLWRKLCCISDASKASCINKCGKELLYLWLCGIIQTATTFSRVEKIVMYLYMWQTIKSLLSLTGNPTGFPWDLSIFPGHHWISSFVKFNCANPCSSNLRFTLTRRNTSGSRVDLKT